MFVSTAAVGSIVGLQSAQIQQMAMEYEEKVTMVTCPLGSDFSFASLVESRPGLRQDPRQGDGCAGTQADGGCPAEADSSTGEEM